MYVASVTVETFAVIVGYKKWGLEMKCTSIFCVCVFFFSYRVMQQTGGNIDWVHSRGGCQGRYPGRTGTTDRGQEEFTD